MGFGQGGHYALSVCGEDRVVRDWWVMVGGLMGRCGRDGEEGFLGGGGQLWGVQSHDGSMFPSLSNFFFFFFFFFFQLHTTSFSSHSHHMV